MKLENKIAIITGASTGIGRAVAIEFAKEGALVFLIARTKDRLIQTKELIEGINGRAEVIEADLSDPSDINSLISEIKLKTDRVDIVANIAGIWHGKNEVFAGKDFDTFD